MNTKLRRIQLIASGSPILVADECHLLDQRSACNNADPEAYWELYTVQDPNSTPGYLLVTDLGRAALGFNGDSMWGDMELDSNVLVLDGDRLVIDIV